MDDTSLVQRAATGDRDAFAAIYERYAARVYDFLSWVLQDREQADNALHETFRQAGARLPALRDPSKFRSWLFAIAGHEALGDHPNRPRLPPELASEAGEVAPPETSWGGVVQVVRATADELSPLDRALLDLRFRQGLEGEELADAVGVSADHGAALVSHLVEQVERKLGTNLVANFGRDDCPELAGLLADWEGRVDEPTRQLVSQHAETCEVCGRRSRKVGATALLAVAPAYVPPAELGERVLEHVELATHPTRRWSDRRDGFPRPIAVSSKRWWVAAGAAAFLVVVAVAALLLTRGDKPTERVSAVGTTTSALPRRTTLPSSAVTTGPSTTTSVVAGAGPAGGSATGTTAGAGGGGLPANPSGVGVGDAGGSGGSGAGSGASGGSGVGGGGGGGGEEPAGPATDTGGIPGPSDSGSGDTSPGPTAAPDTAPPALSGLRVNPSVVRGGRNCSNGDATVATVTVQATDPSGISEVVAVVAGPGTQRVPMAAAGDGTYSATIGPFESQIPAGVTDFPAEVIVQATDGAGNKAGTTAKLTLRCTA